MNFLGTHFLDTVWVGETKDSATYRTSISGAIIRFMICMKHRMQIRDALKLSPLSFASTWRHEGKKDEEGAQIDLLFDRPDGAVTVCEIKYTEEPFKIDKEYFQHLRKKIEIYSKATNTQKQIFLAFVTSAGLKPTIYSEEISAVVTLEELFK